jgi:hypothetical protein
VYLYGKIKSIVSGRILIGFDIAHDLEAMQLTPSNYKSLVDISEFDDYSNYS